MDKCIPLDLHIHKSVLFFLIKTRKVHVKFNFSSCKSCKTALYVRISIKIVNLCRYLHIFIFACAGVLMCSLKARCVEITLQ